MRSSSRLAEAAKRWVPRRALPLARSVHHRLLVPLWCGVVDLDDRVRRRRYDGRVLPPARLRHKVRGTPSGVAFARVGRAMAWNLRRVMGPAGMRLDSCRTILDFGCGPGGTIPWVQELAPRAAFTGTDIDAEAIAWARRNLPSVRLDVNGVGPPLPYADGAFDLAYAISVFTHLDEPHQDLWLAELARVVRPGGLAVVTVHGPASWPDMPPEDRARLERDGFAFVRHGSWEGLFPDWYQSAFHGRRYVEERFARWWEVVTVDPPEMDRYQNLVVLRRSTGVGAARPQVA